MREECKKSSTMQKENTEGKRGNLWVKTCFLGKGLSPSKLSTKALCGDRRKRGNEKPQGNKGERDPVQSKLFQKQRAGIPKAPRSSVVTDLQQGTDDVGTKALLENLTQLADELQNEFCR